MITLILPWPDTELWPNRSNGRSYRFRHQAKVAAKNTGYWLALQARCHEAVSAPLAVEYEFCPPTRRAFDLDGAYSAAKAFQDGIAQALEVDDRVFAPVTLRRGDVRPGGAVVVRIGT